MYQSWHDLCQTNGQTKKNTFFANILVVNQSSNNLEMEIVGNLSRSPVYIKIHKKNDFQGNLEKSYGKKSGTKPYLSVKIETKYQISMCINDTYKFSRIFIFYKRSK